MISRLARPLLQRALGPILVEAGAGFDVAVVRLAQELAKRGSQRSLDADERRAYLERVASAYEPVAPADFYGAPPPLDEVREHRVRDLREVEGGGEVVDLSWSSGWSCRSPEQRERFARWPENGICHVRTLRGRPGRPAIVCIHGYRAGTFSFEERAFAASWLHRLGLDVALFTLPFHALRAPAPRRRTPLFPTGDVARTVEAFGQATWDLRRLVAWLRARGAPKVGVMGMSLGGYTASLLATVEPALDFVVPFIPVADLTDVVVDHEALRGVVVPPALVDAGKRAMALVRPLGRAPAVAPDRILVVGADGDRITPRAHAEALAAHFGSELVTFPGAHLLQFGRRDAFGSIARFLGRLGVVSPRGR